MQAGNQYPVKSLEATQFTEALAVGASSGVYNLQMPRALFGRTLIRNIRIISKENCAWRLDWFSGAAGPTADPQTDTWLGWYSFVEADGQQFNATGLFHYMVPGVNEPYVDLDTINVGGTIQGVPSLHLVLTIQNQGGNVNTKSAGAAGDIVIAVDLEPMAEQG